jgi:acyl-CoA thioesterase FadM
VTLAYEITSTAQGVVVAKGETVVVLVDFTANASLELSADARARIEAKIPT